MLEMLVSVFSFFALFGAGFAVAVLAYAAWMKVVAPSLRGTVNSFGVFALMGGLIASVSINIDLQPFFDSLNGYLPTFVGIFAIIGGLTAAIAFARYIINSFINAFNGGKI